jgi:hypothetical protein
MPAERVKRWWLRVGKGVTNDESEECFLYRRHPDGMGDLAMVERGRETKRRGAWENGAATW